MWLLDDHDLEPLGTWSLGAHVCSTCRFDNGTQIIGVARVVGIQISLERLITDVVSASPECTFRCRKLDLLGT